MIEDGRTVGSAKTVATDICIVGAGPAGISLALELDGGPHRVALLESGGMEWGPETYELNRGESVGLPYKELEYVRFRGFGGTAVGWVVEAGQPVKSGRFRTLDDIDFEKREWVPGSGWPFRKSELIPYYEEAQKICGLGPLTYDLDDWWDEQSTPGPGFRSNHVEPTVFQAGRRTQFTEAHRDTLVGCEHVTVYHHATVTELEREESEAISRIRVASGVGNSFWLTAKVFVLAAGGIENARLMLASRGSFASSVGNEHDLVGRFFMEHPHVTIAALIPADQRWFSQIPLHSRHPVGDTCIERKYSLSTSVLRRERLLSLTFGLEPRRVGELDPDLGSQLLQVSPVDGETWAFRIHVMSEQAPNRNSRVILSDKRDPLGSRQARLDWQLSHLDLRTLVRGQEIIAEELRLADLGTVVTRVLSEDFDFPLYFGNHHMGTTRMSEDSEEGVVDPNCRVHGVHNLFIAGSSVFPSSGCANPTLTLVALAVRLARHLRIHLFNDDSRSRIK